MKIWKDFDEFITAGSAYMANVSKNEKLDKIFRGLNVLVSYDYSQDAPDCYSYLDTRDGKFEFHSGKPSDEPNLTMTMSLDMAHNLWAGKTNPMLAMTTKKVKTRGSVAPFMKLAPNQKLMTKIYEETLKDLGMEDKLA